MVCLDYRIKIRFVVNILFVLFFHLLFLFFLFFIRVGCCCCCCCCRLFVSSFFFCLYRCAFFTCTIHTLISIAPENRFENWNWPNCGSYRIVICFEFDLFFRTLFIIYNVQCTNQKLMIERLFYLFCFVSLLAWKYKQNKKKTTNSSCTCVI